MVAPSALAFMKTLCPFGTSTAGGSIGDGESSAQPLNAVLTAMLTTQTSGGVRWRWFVVDVMDCVK
jgi:hypothetical protein